MIDMRRMKRYTKMFENFSHHGGQGLWALMFHVDLVMYGLYDTLQEAEMAKERMNDYLEEWFRSEYGEEEPYDREAEDMIDVQQVFPGTSTEEDSMLFVYSADSGEYAEGWPGQTKQEMVKKLIMAGGNPFSGSEDYGSAFSSVKNLERFFGGDISWYPGGMEKAQQDLAAAADAISRTGFR